MTIVCQAAFQPAFTPVTTAPCGITGPNQLSRPSPEFESSAAARVTIARRSAGRILRFGGEIPPQIELRNDSQGGGLIWVGRVEHRDRFVRTATPSLLLTKKTRALMDVVMVSVSARSYRKCWKKRNISSFAIFHRDD